MKNAHERLHHREEISIDDITYARIAVDRFKHSSSPFSEAYFALVKIINAVDMTTSALRYIETEGRNGQMPLIKETPLMERVMEALDTEDEVITSERVENLMPSLFAVLSYPDTQKNNHPSAEAIERLDKVLYNWELIEYSRINEEAAAEAEDAALPTTTTASAATTAGKATATTKTTRR